MGTGGILPRSDNGKVHDIMTLRNDPRREIRRYLSLGATNQCNATCLQIAGNYVNCGTRRAQGFDLCRVFAHPQ
ncbi:unannotated protein [freshwater metagenome]|uniref:Unannotated protein n=1 Tax=freshwater metagenome TaxID=449393 RepID=A0A6J6BEW6_9ZZZZ